MGDAPLTLEQFFMACRSLRVGYGRHDCLTWTAAWIITRGHPDPMGPHRGAYSSAAGARRIIKAEGGIVATMRNGAARSGLAEISPELARSGDVGVGRLEALTDWGLGAETALIRAGEYWAALNTPGGLIIGPAEAAAVWRV